MIINKIHRLSGRNGKIIETFYTRECAAKKIGTTTGVVSSMLYKAGPGNPVFIKGFWLVAEEPKNITQHGSEPRSIL